MEDRIFLIAIIPLVIVIVGLVKHISNMSDDTERKRSLLMDSIESLREKINNIECKVARLTADNEELKRDNNELRTENAKWRQAARKWYLIAVSINGELRSQAEDGLEEPTDIS